MMGDDTHINMKFSKDLQNAVSEKLDGGSLSSACAAAMRQIIDDPFWLTQGNFYRAKNGFKKEAFRVNVAGKDHHDYADALGANIEDMISNALARRMKIDLGQWPEHYEKAVLSYDPERLYALTPEHARKILPGNIEGLQKHSHELAIPDFNLELKRGGRFFQRKLDLLREESAGASKKF